MQIPAALSEAPLEYQRTVALRIGHFIGNSGEFRLNRQELYELRRAEQEPSTEIARQLTLDAVKDLRAANRWGSGAKAPVSGSDSRSLTPPWASCTSPKLLVN